MPESTNSWFRSGTPSAVPAEPSAVPMTAPFKPTPLSVSVAQRLMSPPKATLPRTPASAESSTTAPEQRQAPAHSLPWQTLTAADLSRPWAEMTDSSDNEDAPCDTPLTQPNSLNSSYGGAAAPRRSGAEASERPSPGSAETSVPLAMPRSSTAAQPVRMQIGFKLNQVDGAEAGSPAVGSFEARPLPLRAVPSALSILNKEVQVAAVICEPHLEAVRKLDDDAATVDMVSKAAAGLKAGRVPEAPREGMGGTYFLSDTLGVKVGIFKPCDEEPMAPNNPKGWSGRAMGAPGMKPGVRVGEAALREVAAYLLDHGGFAGVPPACLVSARHPSLSYGSTGGSAAADTLTDMCISDASVGLLEAAEASGEAAESAGPDHRLISPVLPGGLKLGSLQAFAAHESDANEVAPQRYCSDSVHRIGVLDVRLLNLDRHAGNLLVMDVKRSCARAGVGADMSGTSGPQLHALVPIDHGYALPEALHNPYFEWQYWPQASVPFSGEVRAYVAALDGVADAAMLARRLPELRPECLRCLLVTTMVLKKCVADGLTLFEMASMMTRPVESAPSDFEALCMDAREAALLQFCGGSLPYDGASALLLCSHSGDAGAAESGSLRDSLAMSGMGGSLSAHSDSSPKRLAVAAEDGRESADASPGSPCMVGSVAVPQAIAQSWLRTAPLTSPGNDSSDWGPAAFATLAADEPPRDDSEGCARSDLCMPPALSTGPMTEARGGRGGRSGALRRCAWEGRNQVGHGPVYPPLLEAVHPDKANYVFSGLSEAQWEVFMAQLAGDLDEELAKGTWRVRRHTAPVAASCPEPGQNRRF